MALKGVCAVSIAIVCGGLTEPLEPSRPGKDDSAGEAASFQLLAVQIDGGTVYRPGELAPLYDDYLTRKVSVQDLAQIAQAITDKYRADGYFLSRAVVPPQVEGSGVARILVYEGYVGAVEVSGSGAAAVERHLAGLTMLRPLRLAELDRRLSLAGDDAGVSIQPELQPVVDNPAEHRLVISAGLRRLDLDLYVDNRGSRAAGPWQTYVRGAVNSGLAAGDQLSLAVLTIPDRPKELTFAELSYIFPLGAGPQLRGAVSGSRSGNGVDRSSERFGSESWDASLAYRRPLARGQRLGAWLMASVDAHRVEQHWGLFGGYRDDIAAVRSGFAAQAAKSGRLTQVSGQLSAGQVRSGAVGASRSDAPRDFWKLNAHVSHYRDIGERAGLFLAADGQWSPTALAGSEELALGGSPYGRGYDYAEISGDRGLAGSIEFRAGWDPKVAPITFVQGYAFLDVGQVWNDNPKGHSASLASTGLGARVRLGQRVTMTLEAARPLTRTPYDRGDKEWRPYLALSSRF